MISTWHFSQILIIKKKNYRHQHFDRWLRNSKWCARIENFSLTHLACHSMSKFGFHGKWRSARWKPFYSALRIWKQLKNLVSIKSYDSLKVIYRFSIFAHKMLTLTKLCEPGNWLVIFFKSSWSTTTKHFLFLAYPYPEIKATCKICLPDLHGP